MRYVFADCLLDTQLYTLSWAGLAIPLRPKAFHVLRYLLEHRDHLVSKEELCTHVWPAQFISDATIEGCIKRVRHAVGDTGRAQQLIQTRRGYGYRFVEAVAERPEASPAHAPKQMSLVSVTPSIAPRAGMRLVRRGRMTRCNRHCSGTLGFGDCDNSATPMD
jgi:DNA-binding winged helix-turn-helix (wHTH) protein